MEEFNCCQCVLIQTIVSQSITLLWLQNLAASSSNMLSCASASPLAIISAALDLAGHHVPRTEVTGKPPSQLT